LVKGRRGSHMGLLTWILVGGVRRIFWTVVLTIALVSGVMNIWEESHPNPGYVDTGQTVTAEECREQGGHEEWGVCYIP
jgi:hypothetical protein